MGHIISAYPTPVMADTIGERVKRLREEQGFTAAQLGQRSGIGENAIYKIESGDTKHPSFLTGVRLARAFAVDAYFLAFGEREGVVDRGETPTSMPPPDRLAALEVMVASVRKQLLLEIAQTREMTARALMELRQENEPERQTKAKPQRSTA